jgi:hypothetical protein
MLLVAVRLREEAPAVQHRDAVARVAQVNYGDLKWVKIPGGGDGAGLAGLPMTIRGQHEAERVSGETSWSR